MIFASGFEVTSDLKRRWGIDVVEGRNGESIYDHWADGPKTLHGTMTHGFPNQFFIGYIQGGLNASVTEQFGQQGYHIAYIISEALKRGAEAVEPTQEAQDDYVRHFREMEIDISAVPARVHARAISTTRARMKAPNGRCSAPMDRAGTRSRSCCRTGATRAIWRGSARILIAPGDTRLEDGVLRLAWAVVLALARIKNLSRWEVAGVPMHAQWPPETRWRRLS